MKNREKRERKTIFPTSETLLTQLTHFPKNIPMTFVGPRKKSSFKKMDSPFLWGVAVGSKVRMRATKAFVHAFVVATWTTAGTTREITAFTWDEQPPCRLQFPLCSLLQYL